MLVVLLSRSPGLDSRTPLSEVWKAVPVRGSARWGASAIQQQKDPGGGRHTAGKEVSPETRT